jgi:uncharacterized protein YkwD
MWTPATSVATPARRSGPRRLALLLALAFAATSVGLLASPVAVFAWDTGAPSATSEETLTSLTNQSRASAGLRTLATDAALVKLARWRSKDMAERDYFSHSIPPDGKKVFDYMQAEGYCFNVAGENIGWLGGGDEGAEARIHQMFLDSPTHRDVIMGKAWDVIGVGSYKRADGRKFWTVLFADKCSTATPKPAATPKPTLKPTPKPAATPKPIPKPTATATRTPVRTPRPSATPERSPAARTADPTPAPSPTPTAIATPQPTASPTPSPVAARSAGPTATPSPAPQAELGPSGMRVGDAPPSGGLLESFIGGIAAFFFGG